VNLVLNPLSMKKTIIAFGILLLSLSVLVSCNTSDNGKDQTKESDLTTDTTTIDSTTSYLLLTQLAFKAYLFDPDAKPAHTQALYLAAEKDSRDLSFFLDSLSNLNKQAVSSKAEGVSRLVSLARLGSARSVATSGRAIDLCPCPDAAGLCPCPAIESTTIYFATQADNVEVAIGEEQLQEREGQPVDGWTAFTMPNGLEDQSFILKITADFAGLGRETYEVHMQIQDGKLYMQPQPWRR
jgi:hypothetical protein